MFTTILGVPVANPVLVGSGLLTDQERNIRRLLLEGAGAVVTKTIHPDPPENTGERVVRLPTGMLNNTTYSRRPVTDWLAMLRAFADERLPVVASIHASSPEALGELARQVVDVGAPALELGISCFNEESELEDPALVASYTRAVRRAVGEVPFAVKLGVGEGLGHRVVAALGAGADALTLSDTIPGAAVASGSGALELGGVYGYSGPGIKPLVLAAIHQLRESGVTVPILGVGGISSGRDVVDYLTVGADVTQIYSCLHTDMYATLRRVLDESAELTSAVADPSMAVSS